VLGYSQVRLFGPNFNNNYMLGTNAPKVKAPRK
jgi:hypothetical protein